MPKEAEIRDAGTAVPPPFLLAHIRDLQIGLSPLEMEEVVEAVRFALSEIYVHLPQKQSAFGTNILGELDVLRTTIPYLRSESEFVAQLQKTIQRLYDRHTSLVLPAPWKSLIAFLPISLEPCWSQGRRKMIVTRVTPGMVDEKVLYPGLEITHWNGVPIATFVERLSWENQGANPSARIAMALQGLTVRPLGYGGAVPAEDWVTLTTWDGRTSANATLPWLAMDAMAFKNFIASRLQQHDVRSACTVGVDYASSVVCVTRRSLYMAAVEPDKKVFALREAEAAPINPLAENLGVNVINAASGPIGYIRIYSFEHADSTDFLTKFASICALLPERLIIDLRGNPGGTIPSGEIILPLLGKGKVEFSRLQFRNTRKTKAIVDHSDFFKDWRMSMNLAIDTGLEYSQGIPLTRQEEFPDVFSAPRKKTVLIIDGLCYSTTDYFVAGFRDNKLGPVIGVDRLTGAGGANVWGYSLVSEFLAADGQSAGPQMPRDFDMNLSVRRSLRTGALQGMPLEGLGAEADIPYQMTERDVLGRNEDLIEFASKLFDQK